MNKYLLVIAVLFAGLSATILASDDSSSRANGPICTQLAPNHPEKAARASAYPVSPGVL